MKTIHNILGTLAVSLGAVCMLSACSADEEFNGNNALNTIKVDNYPAFSNTTTRSADLGSYDAGKISWETGDEIFFKLTDSKNNSYNGTLVCTMSDGNASWSVKEGYVLAYKGDANITAYYAPGYKWENGELTPKDGYTAGTCDYLEYQATTSELENINVQFSNNRKFARLRVVTDPGTTITLADETFKPAQATSPLGATTITVTADAKGNAYFYGTWSEGQATLTSNVTKTSGTFSPKKTVTMPVCANGKSYAVMGYDWQATVTATCTGYTDDELKGKSAWDNEDSFIMASEIMKKGYKFTKKSGENTFTGLVPVSSGKYFAVYNSTNDNDVLTPDLSEQKGTAGDIPTFMVDESEDLTKPFSLSQKLAVLKLTLTLPSEATGSVSSVILSGLHNKAAYTSADGSSYAYEDANLGNITVTNSGAGFPISDNKITAYIAVFPEEVEDYQMVIYANAGENKYMYTLKNANTLTAGNVIPVNVSMNYNCEGYECVDLGLPSKTKWATCNVGAKKPTEYGGYYAWGETTTKSEYSWSTYMCTQYTCGMNGDRLKDYVYNKKSIAGTDYDVAHVKWGGKWKMPTIEQLKELYNVKYCTTTWTSDYNGTKVAGRIITGNTPGYKGNFIFLPATGCRDDSSLSLYWSAASHSNIAYYACYLGFDSNEIAMYYDSGGERSNGMSVRPVYVSE